jgi:hypothetical protein
MVATVKYYKSRHNQLKAEGIIDKVIAVEQVEQRKKSEEKKEYVFSLATGDRNIVFQCSTEEEKDEVRFKCLITV